MRIMEMVCDQCDGETTEEDNKQWIAVKDGYGVQYHFCSWKCQSEYSHKMAAWEQYYYEQNKKNPNRMIIKNGRKVVRLKK